MSEKDVVEEARDLADFLASMKEWRSQNQIRTEIVLRALADEVERLRKDVKGVEAERDAAIAQYERQWS